MSFPLVCSVRGCREPLALGERSWTCPRGHAFDVAREGYVNVLQPQDRRSLDAGDAKDVVAARRALHDAGFGDALGEVLESAVSAALRDAPSTEPARVLDLGCGEGAFLARVAARLARDGRACEAAGIDLSVHAIALAARRHPRLTWVVANADRALPVGDACVDVALSVDGRRNAAEAWRVLRPRGAWIVAVAADDDLAELRASVLGATSEDARADAVVREAGERFEVVARASARARRRVGPRELAWIAAATYRCGRRREQERLEALSELDVTSAHDVVTFRRRELVS